MKSTRILLSLIILVLINISGYSQKLVELYKDYLPKIVFTNDENMEQIEYNLEYYSSINPQLISNLIDYINLKFGEKINDNEKNGYNKLRQLTNLYIYRKNLWVKEVIKKIPNEVGSSELASGVKSQINDLENSEIFEKHYIKEDPISNKSYYFMCIFLNADFDKHYDASVVYEHIFNALEVQKVNHFKKEFSTELNLDSQKKYNLVDEAKQYAFLFSRSYLGFITTKTDFSIALFIAKMLEDDYQEKITFGIFGQYYITKYNFLMKESMEITDIHFPNFELNKSWEYELEPAYSFGLECSIPLREKYSFVSHINISVGMLYKFDEQKTDHLDSVYNIYINDVKKFTGNYNLHRVKSEQWGLTSHFTIPIYYFTKDFSIELGVFFAFTVSDISFDLDKSWTVLYSGDLDDFLNPKKTVNYSLTDFVVSPTLSVNYTLFDFLNLRASFLAPLSTSFTISTDLFSL